jgi:hypothetical protein
MKQIGQAIGVNESRVSQLHARAITRLRLALESPAKGQRPRLVSRPAAATTAPKPRRTHTRRLRAA